MDVPVCGYEAAVRPQILGTEQEAPYLRALWLFNNHEHGYTIVTACYKNLTLDWIMDIDLQYVRAVNGVR